MSCACDGRPLGERLKAQIGREFDRLEPLLKRIAAVEEAKAMLARRLASQREGDRAGVRRRRLDGGALPLFRQPPVGWRLRRPRADAVAQRCDRPRAGGCRKPAIRPSRKTMLQLAWLWLIHQPQSALSRWYRERFPA